MRSRNPLCAMLAAVVMLATLVVAPATAGAARAGGPAIPPSELPAPFSTWHVAAAPIGGNPRVLNVSFDSPLLQRRISNTVYLPDAYRGAAARTPVMYALHGTVFASLDNCALNPVTEKDTLFRVI